MKANNFHIKPANDHVSLELLRQYQADALPPAAQHQVEKHLLGCELCSDVLEGMEASPAPVTQRAVADINQRIAASLARRKQVIPFYADWKNYGVAAAVVLLLLSGALVLYYNFTQVKQTQQTVAVERTDATPDAGTVLKPAEPVIAEADAADATAAEESLPEAAANRSVIALNKPPASAPGSAMPTATAPTPQAEAAADVEIMAAPASGAVVGGTESVAPDSLTIASAPKAEEVEQKLQGRVAGVAVSKRAKSARAERSMQDNANVLGNIIRGKVTDDNGETIPGVTVVLKGTSVGAVTDFKGEYTLTLPEGINKPTLVYSFIGYTTTEKAVTNANEALAMNVKLNPDTKALSEVVVVGYGTPVRNEVTGAVTYAKPASGFRAFKKYIQANLQYPEAAKAKKVKGRVVVGFTVNPNGTLSDFRIIKSLSPECDAEALRLVKEGPRWEPTKKDDTAVSEQVRISIRFKP